jgi:hypothetical protein
MGVEVLDPTGCVVRVLLAPQQVGDLTLELVAELWHPDTTGSDPALRPRLCTESPELLAGSVQEASSEYATTAIYDRRSKEAIDEYRHCILLAHYC